MKKSVFIVVAIILGLAISANANTNSSVFPDIIKRMTDVFRKLFGVDYEQIASIVSIVNAWNQYGDGDRNKLAYIMATAWHESRLRPIIEIKASSDTSLWTNYQSKYWPSGFYGRGFVQLTWEKNYKKMGDWLGIDLVGNPNLALVPEYAAKILVYGMMQGSFTGVGLGNYINSSKLDFYNARRVVNGTDKATLIASYASDIQNNIA